MPATPIDARRILGHCDALSACTEEPGKLTRVFLSPEATRASELVLGWMREAGMSARLDAIGNVVGRVEGREPALPCLMLGSHLDTVRDAGRYDGMLGVVAAIECVRALGDKARSLPFAIEVVGFGDEEGVRFGATLIGSRAIAGDIDPGWLDLRDAGGVSMREALAGVGLPPERIHEAARRRDDLLAYAELHIEQGPVLEAENLPVGVVTAINGFTRLAITLRGEAGHAGTVPMNLRRDALAAAAECVLAVERIAGSAPELVGTVGRIEALPGAINVIPGEVRFTIDLRAPDDALRARAVREVRAALADIAGRRRVALEEKVLIENPVAPCADWLASQFAEAIEASGLPVRRLPSGAGHDGMAIQRIADIAMLFMRCKGGISHNPAEAVLAEDVAVAARVLLRFIENFRPLNT